MGKDLKGKELGVGIAQRKDGLYTGRYTDNRGVRRQKYFKKLQECRQWIADMQFEKEHCSLAKAQDMCVDAWFNYVLTEIKGNNVRKTTIESYTYKYDAHIKEYIGNMLLNEVKSMHCQNILNKMADKYRISYIKTTRALLYNIFQHAVDYEIILTNPVKKTVQCTTAKEIKEQRVLTLQEQSLFLEQSKNHQYHNQFAFLLQTGLRAGEMIGLKWSDIDFENKVLSVNRTFVFSSKHQKWIENKPKTKTGMRKVPLTSEAIKILLKQKEKNKAIKVIPMQYADIIFLSRKGTLVRNGSYDVILHRLCEKLNLDKFSMHTLRHTFATRCIEAGMKPKTLQSILGHSNIKMTMDLYVHCTEDEKNKEIELLENMLMCM